MPSVVTEEEVMFFDTDAGGVVHNLAYLRWVETARTRLAAVMGWSLKRMAETGEFAVVLRTEADYRSPARLGDVVEVRGRLERVERVRFWCGFEVVRRGDGALLVECRQALALVKMPEGKPLRLPGEMRERWRREPPEAAEMEDGRWKMGGGRVDG